MTTTKRDGFEQLNFETNSGSFVITSRDYLANLNTNSTDDRIAKAEVIQTSDEIYWGSADFAESAFSSPDAFREITRIVLDVEHPQRKEG